MTIEEYRNLIAEKYKTCEYSVKGFSKGTKVKFLWQWADEPTLLTGYIEVIDIDGGGICANVTPSFDIRVGESTYKHVSIVDVVEIVL